MRLELNYSRRRALIYRHCDDSWTSKQKKKDCRKSSFSKTLEHVGAIHKILYLSRVYHRCKHLYYNANYLSVFPKRGARDTNLFYRKCFGVRLIYSILLKRHLVIDKKFLRRIQNSK